MAYVDPKGNQQVRQKYVSVQSSVILPELGNIQGPIINPVWMPITVIKTLIYNGRLVYEHCITEPVKRVRLTKANYLDFNIYPEIEDPSVKPNTYLVKMTDAVSESEMAPGNLYVEIL